MTYIDSMTQNVSETETVTARINENGRIVIPADFRKSLGLTPGDVVVMSLENDALRIESQAARVRKIQEEFKKFAAGKSLASEELIAERREEARREAEEWLG